jgi:hypothetical protein
MPSAINCCWRGLSPVHPEVDVVVAEAALVAVPRPLSIRLPIPLPSTGMTHPRPL